MKTRNYYLLAVVAIVAGLNLFLSVNGQSLVADLKLLTVEAMANTEVNKDGRGTLKPIPCTISTDYIVGHDSNGNPIIERRDEFGEKGICEPYGSNPCTPYECTRRL